MSNAARSCGLFLGIVLLLAATDLTLANTEDARIEATARFVVNPAEGSSRQGCATPAGDVRTKADVWATFAGVEPNADLTWKAAGRDLACGSGAFEIAETEPTITPAAPYLIATVTTSAGFMPGNLTPQSVLLVDVILALKTFAGFESGGEPTYEQSRISRRFYLLDEREVLVPIFIAGDAELDAFGVRDLFLKISLESGDREAGAAYGRLMVIAKSAGLEVLLDGSAVGRTPEGGEMILENVPAGLRSLRLRNSSGRESGDVVRVVAGRTVVVDPGLPGEARRSKPFSLVPLGENVEGYETFRRDRDGAVVVKIPGAEYVMGNRETERTPFEHTVYVSDFLIDEMGVTWRQYKQFAAATGAPLPPQEPYWGIRDDHPAVFVTWEEAKTYCEWTGGRLPTEAERELAARGTDGRKFPWGDDEPDPQLGVFRHAWGYEATEAVGTHPAGVSPYGLHDMGGNVWEWCSDWYSDEYYAESPLQNPRGPASGNAHVVRGGSWDSRPDVLSSSCRNWGYRGYREGDFGFRCAMNAGRPEETPSRRGSK